VDRAAGEERQVTGGATRLRADARRNRQQIIAAAREVFVERGVDAPLDEIARRAGVGIATLYRRFPDRHALIQEVALDNLALLLEELDRAAAHEPDAWNALVRFLHTVVRTRIGTLIPLVVPHLRDDLHAGGEVQSRREQVVGRLQRLVDAAQRQGRLRAGIGLGDVVLGIVKLSRPLPMLTAEVNELAAGRQLELFIDGLRPTAADGSGLHGTPLRITDLDRHLT
jgi:AcrR family transcriptional regulator